MLTEFEPNADPIGVPTNLSRDQIKPWKWFEPNPASSSNQILSGFESNYATVLAKLRGIRTKSYRNSTKSWPLFELRKWFEPNPKHHSNPEIDLNQILVRFEPNVLKFEPNPEDLNQMLLVLESNYERDSTFSRFEHNSAGIQIECCQSQNQILSGF